MSKSLYVLILLLISVSFWNIKPIGGFMTNDIGLISYLVWLLYGFSKFRSRNYKLLCNKRYNKPIILILIAVLISFIPAYLYYGQTFIQSLVVNRELLSYLSLPLLLAIRPSFDDLKKALDRFAFLYIAVVVLDSFLGINIINRDIQSADLSISDGDYVRHIQGVQFIALGLFFSLQDLNENLTLRNVLKSSFFIIIIFLVQNRSTLFPCALLFVFTVLRAKGGKYEYLVKSGLVVLVIVLFVLTSSQWITLFEETQSQLNDSEYNRIKAYTYFLSQYNPHWICNVIGNGFISTNASSVMQMLMSMGIYNSDVGLVGFWNHFGLLPIIVILSLIVRAFKRDMAYVIKCNAFFLLICSLTIAYFVRIQFVLWLCLFIYMYNYNDLINRCNKR